MSPDRVVKTTLVIDDHGSVKVVKGVGEEAGRTEHKLSGLDKGVKGVGKSFSGLKGLLASGAGLVGAGGLIFGLSDVISKTKEVAQETEKFHSITGIGAQQSLQYTQALKARGISGEAAATAFGFLSKNLRTAELQEDKFGKSQTKSALATQKQQLALAKALEKGKPLAIQQAQLSIAASKSTTEVGRQAKALQELTHMSAAQFKALGSEEAKMKTVTKSFEALAAGEKKTRLEKELMGKGALQLAPVLENNNLNIDKQAEKVRKYFGVIQGGAKGQAELLEKQAEAKMAWEGLEYQLGTKLTPVLIKFFGWFSKVVVEVERGHGPWGKLVKDLEGVFKAGKEVWQWFERLVGPTNALKIAVGGLVGVMVVSKVSAFATALGGLTGTATTQGGLLGGAFGKAFGIAAILAIGAFIASKLPSLMEGLTKQLGITPTGGRTRGEFKLNTLLGGNQPHEASREGEAFARRMAHQPGPRPAGPLTGSVHAGTLPGYIGGESSQDKQIREKGERELGGGGVRHSTVELHVDGHKLAETLLQNPRARRQIAEATTIYSHGMAARGHG